MPERIDRREALKPLGAAGVGMAVAPVLLRSREGSITLALRGRWEDLRPIEVQL